MDIVGFPVLFSVLCAKFGAAVGKTCIYWVLRGIENSLR